MLPWVGIVTYVPRLCQREDIHIRPHRKRPDVRWYCSRVRQVAAVLREMLPRLALLSTKARSHIHEFETAETLRESMLDANNSGGSFGLGSPGNIDDGVMCV